MPLVGLEVLLRSNVCSVHFLVNDIQIKLSDRMLQKMTPTTPGRRNIGWE